MEYTLIHNEHTVPYKIKRYARSKSLRVRIGQSGQVTVTGPKYVPIKAFKVFVQQHKSYIVLQVLQIREGKDENILSQDKEHFRQHKAAALALAKKKVLMWNSFYNFDHGRITVRQVTSRWGSCSSKGNLSFSYKIVFLPEALQDYLVVHELCHLVEMNHSKNFWDLVARAIPNFKEARKQLKNI